MQLSPIHCAPLASNQFNQTLAINAHNNDRCIAILGQRYTNYLTTSKPFQIRVQMNMFSK